MSGPKPDALPLGDTPYMNILYILIEFCQKRFGNELTNLVKIS